MQNKLGRFSRFDLNATSTPLEPLPRLSRQIGGPRLFVKRDDCTGLAFGGNKARKLEFLIGDARMKGADTLITVGGLQSNHARQTAAAAAKAGMACELIAVDLVDRKTSVYRESGNMLLNRLFGARVELVGNTGNLSELLQQREAYVIGNGQRPYLLPLGGSTPIGALGYVNCAAELLNQISLQGIALDAIICATGAAGTQAGLIAGLIACGSTIPVIGMSVYTADAQALKETIHTLGQEALTLLGIYERITDESIMVETGYIGEGYGVPTREGWAAIRRLAETEGLLLDPVYTGKAFAGLLAQIEAGRFSEKANILFLHTGGTPALYAYQDDLNEILNRPAFPETLFFERLE